MRSPRVDREHYILKQARGAKQILHIGCSCSPNCERRWNDGTLLHKQLCDQARELGQQVIGVDIDRASLDFLRERMPEQEFRFADAHELARDLPGRRFDLIIAGDVIEHLENPGRLLTSCASVLEPDGRLLVTTINAFGIARFVKALLNHESVHPEHTAYFSWRTIQRICEMCGLSATEFVYCACSFRRNRGSLPGLAGAAIELGFAWIWPQFSDSLAVIARPAPTAQANGAHPEASTAAPA